MKKTLLLLVFLSLISIVKAQALFPNPIQQEKCKTDQRHHFLYVNNPEYRENFDNNKLKVRDRINSGIRSGGVYTIPVVVHVIHLGEAEGTGTNISDAQIQSAINNLNDAYSNTGYNGLDVEVQFVLAARDENCSPTDGIIRVNGSGVTAGGDNYSNVGITDNNEQTIKALSKWSNISYYNIWIVSEIDNNGGGSGTQGYAYFAGAPSSVDGSVILYNAFGYDPTNSLGYNLKSYTNYNVTAIHEIGHALNLYHTFEGDDDGSVCPDDTDCSTDGDECCDTDAHRRDDGSNCDAPVSNTCKGVSNSVVYNNFMAYSEDHCQNRFTADQKTRMRAALETTRSGLTTSLGGTAPSETGPIVPTCLPDYTTPNSFGMGVTNVEFNTISVASGTSQSEGAGRHDRSCQHKTTVDAGSSYSITIGGGVANNQDVEVYIDFNNDGDFDDANENVFSGSNNTSFSGTVNIPANPTLNTYLRMRVIVDWFNNTISGPCYNPQYGEVEEYAVQVTSVSPAPVANFSANSTSVCNNSTVTFTDASTNATGWSWDFGTNASPATATGQGPHVVTYTGAGFSTVSLDVTGPGGSDSETKTNYITRVSTVIPAVTISSNDADNTICSGTSVTFTAVPTNGGSTPSYQWKLNGGNVGSNSSTYNNSSLANGDDVSCVMTSNATCPSPISGTSNTITMTVNSTVTPSVSIVASANPINSGDPVTFTATPTNGGGSPSYQWKLNGGNVGSNSTTYNSSSLVNGDDVSCVMTSSANCPSPTNATSNTVTMVVNSGSCTNEVAGPGGVGNQTVTQVWLDANSLNQNHNDKVETWTDKSGNNHDFTQLGISSKPKFITNSINGQASLLFDGNNDYMNSTSISALNSDNISWSVVVNATVINETGHILSADYTSGSGASNHASHLWKTFTSNGGNYVSFVRKADGTFNSINHTGPAGYQILTNVWDGDIDELSGYRNGSLNSTSTGVNSNPNGHVRLRIGSRADYLTQYYNGNIAEVIVYSKTLNAAERIIVDNYLGTKYNLPLSSNDIYSYEATHSEEAAGIGMLSNESSSSARGGIIEISNPSTLANNDFLMVAHEGSSTGSTTTGTPSAYGGIGKMMERNWRVDKTNDVGTVTVRFYLDGISTGGSTDFELLRDSDGNFTNATRITSGFSYDPGCDVATWTGVSFSDGDYFTIGNPDGQALLIAPILEQTIEENDFAIDSDENNFETLEIVNIETEKVELKLYPNPTSGLINIENQIENASISLLNTLGQTVFNSNINIGKNQFDFSELSAGIYFVQLKEKNGEIIAISQLMINK